MEVWGARYLRADTKQWQTITSAYLEPEDGVPQYEGSYQFGVSENRIWMITSGVGGDWFHNGKGKRGKCKSLLVSSSHTHMGYGADELTVLDDGTAAHADVK